MKVIISIIGCILISLGVNLGFVPVNLFSVAFPGVGLLARYTLDISAGLVVFLLNVPLFFIAWKHIGKEFVIKTFFLAAVLSVFLDLFYPLRHWVEPPLWAGIVIGGILLGTGTGLIFRQGLTSGGVGLLARIIQLRYPTFKMGTIHIVFDFFVLFLGAILMDIMTAFYTFLASIVIGRTMDFVKSVSNPFQSNNKKQPLKKVG